MQLWRAQGARARPPRTSPARAVSALLLLSSAGCVHAGSAPARRVEDVAFPAAGRAVASPLFETAGDERRRDRDGEAEYVIDALRLAPGMRVADIGAGTGYYAIRLAARLGPASLVYAQENDPARLARISARADRERLLNIIPVQGYPNDPALPPGSVDVALVAHAYHQIPGPYEFLYRLAGALAAGGRVGVIGFDRQSVQYGVDPDRLECEFEAVGYRRVAYYLLTPGEAYLAVFEPPDRLPDPSAIVPCGAADASPADQGRNR